MKKLLVYGLFLVVFALVQTPFSYAQNQEKKEPGTAKHPLKIVLHVSDSDHWQSAVSNLNNLAAQYPGAKLRVIVDGTGLYPLQGVNSLTPALAKLAAGGVQIQVCHNALRDQQIAATTLPAFATVIPAAVVGLAESQYDGYAYIKP